MARQRTAQPASSDNPSGQGATFFGTQPASPSVLPDPPFLTAADRAAADREIAALREHALRIRLLRRRRARLAEAASATRSDPRTLDLLGFAERAVRNGCRTKATPDLNHRLFVIVQTKYPKSEWARRYTSWE